MKKEITSKVYDEHILKQGMQFQIDNYYEPKEIIEKRRVEIILEAVAPKAGEKILDVGCGVGTFAFHISKYRAITFGIDYSEESVKMAQILMEKYNFINKPEFIVANAVKMPFKDDFFDKVVAVDFIEHITSEEKEMFLREIYRVLKPKGLGIIFTPNGIREKIGEVYWKCRHLVFGDKIPTTDLHFGLTNKLQFEPLIRKYKFNFRLLYKDITRPYLAKIPLIRNFLSLNLLCIMKKI